MMGIAVSALSTLVTFLLIGLAILVGVAVVAAVVAAIVIVIVVVIKKKKGATAVVDAPKATEEKSENAAE